MTRKSETLNLRVTPEFKELVRVAAERESRSISNLLELVLRDYCRQRGMGAVGGGPGEAAKNTKLVLGNGATEPLREGASERINQGSRWRCSTRK